jgi:hypothetical protein
VQLRQFVAMSREKHDPVQKRRNQQALFSTGCACMKVLPMKTRHSIPFTQSGGMKLTTGKYFMEPSDYYDAPIDKVLHFIRRVGLIKG